MFEFKAYEVRKCGALITRDGQFSDEQNADIGHYGLTLNNDCKVLTSCTR